jgi:hypothetical protein
MISLAFLLVAVLFVLSVAVLGCGPKLENLLLDGDLTAALSEIGRCLLLFVDIPSLGLVLLGIGSYTLLFGPKEFSHAGQAFGAFSFPQDEESVKAGRFFLNLAEFTPRWGVFCMFFGLILMLTNLDPDTIGRGIAISLLSFFYASGLAVFVFLPIGLRLTPSETPPSFRKPTVRLSLTGLGIFFMIGFIIFATNPHGFFAGEFVGLNPYMILLFIDIPSLVLVVGSWWAFRLASGKRREFVSASAVITIGAFWSIQSFVLVFNNLDPDTLGPGIAVSVITLLYASIAAACFLIGDMRRSFKALPPTDSFSRCSEGGEQAKEIIDRVVEHERR